MSFPKLVRLRNTAKNIPIIHPFLFALLPIFSLYRANMKLHGFPFDVVYMPAVVLIGFTALSLAALGLILRDKQKAALLLSWFLILFFSYGHLRDFCELTVGLNVPYVVGGVLGLLFLGGIFAISKIRRSLNPPVFFISGESAGERAVASFQRNPQSRSQSPDAE